MKRPTPGWPTAARAWLARSLALAALLAMPAAQAASSFNSVWQGIYPASDSLNNADCQLCHAGSTQNLNPYGESICASTAGTISNRIRDVESLDSDFDPAATTNLAEITAGAQPGWTPGNVNPTYSRSSCNPTGLTEAPPTFIAGELDPAPGNQSPVADANGPYSGTVGVAVTFDGSGSSDPDGAIVTWDWDFGDGNSGTGPSPTHTYLSDATFTVVLTVTDDAGATDTASTAAVIGLGNQPPVADANGPYSGIAGTAIRFDGTGSSDPDGRLVAYAWDFGDGATGSGASPTHTYTAAGMFNVTLTVTDDAGATDSAASTAAITAQPVNAPPMADAGGPYSGIAGLVLDFDGSGSSDPDGTIVAWDWDFGDGMTGSGVAPSHVYGADGSYTVSLTVTDDAGASATATTTASVGRGNQAPVADPMGPYSGTVGVAVGFDGSGSSDPDGTIVAWDWDFGDGMTGSGVAPSHVYGADGSYTVSLTVTDDAGATGSASTTARIGAGNLPPVAEANGPYSGVAGMPVAFSSRGSSDPDGAIVAYRWDFGDGSTATGAHPQHAYRDAGLYHVTLEVMDADGATDSAMTTADISEAGTTVGDVSLARVLAPRRMNVTVGERMLQRVMVIGRGHGLTQDATVGLTVVAPAGVTVNIRPASATLPVSPEDGATRYRFRAVITCETRGVYRLAWTATIAATANSEPGNDTLTRTTKLRCRVQQPDDDDEDDEAEEED